MRVHLEVLEVLYLKRERRNSPAYIALAVQLHLYQFNQFVVGGLMDRKANQTSASV